MSKNPTILMPTKKNLVLARMKSILLCLVHSCPRKILQDLIVDDLQEVMLLCSGCCKQTLHFFDKQTQMPYSD